jgi:hypothetical protein
VYTGSEYGLQAKISEAETSRLKAQQPSDRLRTLAPPNFGVRQNRNVSATHYPGVRQIHTGALCSPPARSPITIVMRMCSRARDYA